KESFYPKQYKYDETNDCYICPENKILLYSTTNREGYRIYKSKKSLCENCPSLSKCTKSKIKVKVIIRHIWQEYIDYCEWYRLTKAGKSESMKRLGIRHYMRKKLDDDIEFTKKDEERLNR